MTINKLTLEVVLKPEEVAETILYQLVQDHMSDVRGFTNSTVDEYDKQDADVIQQILDQLKKNPIKIVIEV